MVCFWYKFVSACGVWENGSCCWLFIMCIYCRSFFFGVNGWARLRKVLLRQNWTCCDYELRVFVYLFYFLQGFEVCILTILKAAWIFFFNCLFCERERERERECVCVCVNKRKMYILHSCSYLCTVVVHLSYMHILVKTDACTCLWTTAKTKQMWLSELLGQVNITLHSCVI